jgi:uncharacterized protein YkwD
MTPLLRVLVLAGALLALGQPAQASEAYRAYAIGLVKKPPAGVKFRPDLEAYLDGLAASARRSGGRKGLKASELLRIAARAQALEMLKGDFVGHSSASGYRFGDRFAAFATEADLLGGRGENAARDRQPGAVDKGKAGRLFKQWLDSGGHRRNLMNRTYKFVSTGAVQKGNHLYAVQIFWEGAPPDAPPPSATGVSLGAAQVISIGSW